MNCFNLMPAPRRQAKACRTRIRQWLAPLAAFAAMLVMICITFHRTWGVSHDPLVGEINLTLERIDSSGRTIKLLNKQLVASRWKLETCKGVGQQPDWSVMLKFLSDGLGDEIVLRSCELREMRISKPGPKADTGPIAFMVNLSGFGRSQTAVSQFVLRLERSGLFNSVRLSSTDREAFGDSKAIAFRLKCTLEGASPAKR